MRIITIDFETAWNSKDYSISKMNLDQYINDSRFHAQIFVFRINRSEVNVINGRHDAYIRTAIRELGLDRPYTITVGHNIRKLDALILERKYGVTTSFILDTMEMSRFLGIVRSRNGGSHKELTRVLGNGVKTAGTVISDGKKWPNDFSVLEQQQFIRYCYEDVLQCSNNYYHMVDIVHGRKRHPSESGQLTFSQVPA